MVLVVVIAVDVVRIIESPRIAARDVIESLKEFNSYFEIVGPFDEILGMMGDGSTARVMTRRGISPIAIIAAVHPRQGVITLRHIPPLVRPLVIQAVVVAQLDLGKGVLGKGLQQT
jgi:hypothetical protein